MVKQHTLLSALEAEGLRLQCLWMQGLMRTHLLVWCVGERSLPVLLRALTHHMAHSHDLIYT